MGLATQILRQKCTTCGKIAVEESRLKVGKTVIIKLACGHILHSESLAASSSSYDSIVFADGCKPRPYQIEAIKFAEEADARCIIADEQGLGKTIESLSLLRLHPEKLLPAVIVCPATVKLQWMFEIHRICGSGSEFLVQVIQSNKERAMPGFKIYVVTYDMLKNEKMFDFLPENSIKTLIIDECQRIKNHQSDRAKAVQKVARNQQIAHIIPMSGTPIKNNAGEYFTVLNLVKPTFFPHYQRFLDNYCDTYSSGWGTKVGGLKNVAQFHEDTKDIIIRRTKDEVLKDLPLLDRKFHHVELDRKLNKTYDNLIKELEENMYEDDFRAAGNRMAIMSQLRHVTGISKVTECVDFATEFLLSTDRKLVLFVHHIDVMGMLETQLNTWLADGGFGKACTLTGTMDGDARTRTVTRFREDNNSRLLIASTLAAGEGLNLQFCSDAVILERQWNPANEEQVEGRFHRFGQLNPVSITYMIASGTIDDLFTELVEQKRAIVAATMDNREISWDQQSLMKELSEALVSRGRKAWSL